MKNIFVKIIQNCIYLDIYLSYLIDYSYSIDTLTSIKEENSRNMKLLSQLYKNIYHNSLDNEFIRTTNSLSINEVDLNSILILSFNILSDLKRLKKYAISNYSKNILTSLNNSYFNLISSMQSLYPLIKPKSKINLRNSYNLSNDSRILNICEKTKDDTLDTTSDEYLRFLCIKTINAIFDDSLCEESIIDEDFDIFFDNNDALKFYQYFFKTKNKIYKIRISKKDNKIFYIYQRPYFNLKILPIQSKDFYQKIVDEFLKNKLSNSYNDLYYDKNYIKTYQYDNIIESYTFKYDYKHNDFNKSLYININTLNSLVYELLLLENKI